MDRTGILYDDIYLRHLTGEGHPESPDRLKAISQVLREEGFFEKCQRIEPREATDEELSLVHTQEYISRLASVRPPEGGLLYLDPDTPVSPESFHVAKIAVGGLLNAMDYVLAGGRAFAFPRPPGHHAEKDRGMGFCLFNNVAVAARYAQRKHSVAKVLIVDWDLHHGNGTQHAFYDDESVLYFSTHQYPYYPGTGSWEETGSGRGVGYTVNVPLSPGQGDQEYVLIFTEILRPIALNYSPDLILVSAGFDTYHLDPLGAMDVTEDGYRAMAGVLRGIAEDTCRGRICFVLEGGYHLEGLAASARAVLESLMDGARRPADPRSASSEGLRIITEARKIHGRHWSSLRKGSL